MSITLLAINRGVYAIAIDVLNQSKRDLFAGGQLCDQADFQIDDPKVVKWNDLYPVKSMIISRFRISPFKNIYKMQESLKRQIQSRFLFTQTGAGCEIFF